MLRTALIGAAILGMSAAAAIAAPPPPTPGDVAVFKEKGAYVFRSANDSRPLYTFDRDAAGKSNCKDACATAWPPLAAAEGGAPVGDWSVIRRDDGSHQWAWRGRPVYTFAKDGPEKATGDGLGGVWRLLPTASAS